MKEILEWIKINKKRVAVFLFLLAAANAFLFRQLVLDEKSSDRLEIHQLDVGQGDSTLIILPSGVKMLLDGGPPNKKAARELSKILGQANRYIDLVLLSHPQLDHFGGLIDVLERYKVGAFISNGEKREVQSYKELENALAAKGIKTIILAKGDKIHHLGSTALILNPSASEIGKNKNLNDSSLVIELISKNTKALFTGDISAKKERKIASLLASVIEILKVAHHGSKSSTDSELLQKAQPKIALIGVGKNSYGHPHPQTLSRLQRYNIKTFRTDQNGTIKVISDGKKIQVFPKK